MSAAADPVLFVGHTASLGGAELYLLDLTAGLHAEGEGVTVCLFSGGPLVGALRERGVSVEVLPASPAVLGATRDGAGAGPIRLGWDTAALAVRLARRVRRARLVWANTQKALIVSALATHLARRPLVWNLHDLLTDEHFSAGRRRLAVGLANATAARVAVNSRATAEAFRTAGGRAATVLVPNGIDAGPFQAVSEAEARGLRQSLALSDGPVVGVFGRLSPWKGQDVFLDALARLPGVHGLVVGDALFEPDRDFANALRARAGAPDLRGRVTFTGFRRDVPALMRACNAVAHTSTSAEPFGRVIVEAMLARRPVVATEAGGAAEIVEDGVTGRLVPRGDAAALAAAVRDALSPGGRALVEAARTHARDHYSLEAMLRAWRGVVTSINP